MVVSEFRSHDRVMELCHELAQSGHVTQARGLCQGCQETRLLSTRTAKDIRDIPPSPKKILRGSPLEEALIYGNPAVVPGSITPDPKTGEPWVTVRCLHPGCNWTDRVPVDRLRRHPLCPEHRREAVLERATAQGRPRLRRRKSRGPSEEKIPWRGRVVSIQPRIRLLRSFDERSHSYLGYVLGIKGKLGSVEDSSFQIAIGEGAQKKHQFRFGDEVSGVSVPVADAALETAGSYKTSGLELHSREEYAPAGGGRPPFHLAPPDLPTYRRRGHRRLDARTFESKCTTCVWGCKMAVEIIRDHWNRSRGPGNVTRRMETFCYGPRECVFYKPGPVRKVRGRKSWMIHVDDGDSTGEH